METVLGFTYKTHKEDMIGAIARTWLMTRQRAKKILADMDYDLTFEQVMVLHILAEEEGLNLGALAEKADRERTTMSRMVDGLEKRNLVVRVKDKEDNRQRLIYLTHLGKERLVNLRPIGDEFHDLIYKGLDKAEILSCLETLDKILKNLEED